MERCDLTEGTPRFGVVLPRAVAVALSREKIATVVPSAAADAYDISNIRKVGVIVIAGVVVRIRPKTPIARLFALLAYSRDPGALWRDDPVALDEDADVYSSIAQPFVSAVERAVAGGLLRGYGEREEALPIVRGRWRVADQMTRRAGAMLLLEVTFDDLESDIAENRMLKSALLRLVRFRDLPAALAGRLRRALRLFDEVTALVPGAPLPAVRIDRRNRRYKSALDLARLILTSGSLEHRDGAFVGSAFLLETWTIFEDFVGAALSTALEQRGGQAGLQYPGYLDSGRLVSIEPDLVWRRDAKVAACVDFKYKVEKFGSFPNADVYQMLAYCTRFGLPLGHLIYAAGEGDARRVDVVGGATIVQHALDLNVPFANLLDQVDSIAERIAESSGERMSPAVADVGGSR